MSISAELDTKLRVFCARVRVADFFKPFDRVTLRRIEPINAIRALDMAGLRLTAAEQEAIKQAFTDSYGFFEYTRFTDEYSDTKPAGYLERHPEAAASMTHASSYVVSPLEGGSAGFFVTLSPDEHAKINELLDNVRQLVRTRGIVIKQFLKDFDTHHRGMVTKGRFLREMTTCLPSFKAADLELIAKAYMTADLTDVRYMVFHNDVTPSDEETNTGVRGVMGISSSKALTASLKSTSSTGAAKTSFSSSKAGPDLLGMSNISKAVAPHRMAPSPERTMDYKCVPSDDLEAIMATIIRQIYERRIRTADLFHDFDKARTGDMGRNLFTRALAAARLHSISPDALQTVADAYSLPTDPMKDLIRWRDFAEDIEKAFYEVGLEKDPTKEPDSFARTVVTSPHPRLVRPTLEASAAAALEKALDGIKHHIKTWRTYNVKAFLSTYDKASEGMVTETQFLRVLASFNLVPQAADERNAVMDYFRGTGHRSHMIDYRAFLREVYNDGIE